MRLSTVDEELLLYVDNELTAQEKKVVELELKANKDYQLQHDLLMKAKLPASEKIVYPNKKELYRKEETRVVLFRPWMRVAAAVVVIAMAGVLYFTNSNSPVSTQDPKLTATKGNNEAKTIALNNRQQTTDTGNSIVSTKDQHRQKIGRAHV